MRTLDVPLDCGVLVGDLPERFSIPKAYRVGCDLEPRLLPSGVENTRKGETILFLVPRVHKTHEPLARLPPRQGTVSRYSSISSDQAAVENE